jgi:hypothetical protein
VTPYTIPSAERPADRFRRWVRAGLIPALVVAVSGDVAQLERSKECRGDFSYGFSRDFDVRHCDLVVRRVGGDLELRLSLPR